MEAAFALFLLLLAPEIAIGSPAPAPSFQPIILAPSQSSQAVQRYITQLTTYDGASFNTTISYLNSGGLKDAPVLLFLNGASCDSWDYSNYLDRLTEAGFVTIITDEYQYLSILGFPFVTKPGCPTDKIVFVTNKIIGPIFSFLEDLPDSANGTNGLALSEAVVTADINSVILISHSAGSLLVQDIMAGSYPGANATDAEFLGSIMWEGATVTPWAIPSSQFAVFMTSGTMGNFNYLPFYTNATGTKDYVKVEQSNHFGITNFNANSMYQVSPCAQPQDNATGTFQTTAGRQMEVIDTIALVTELEILARVMQDSTAKSRLQNLKAQSPLISNATLSAVG